MHKARAQRQLSELSCVCITKVIVNRHIHARTVHVVERSLRVSRVLVLDKAKALAALCKCDAETTNNSDGNA